MLARAKPKSVMQRDCMGMLPIHYAAIGGHGNVITLLYKYYEQQNNSTRSDESIDRLMDKNGLAALHMACYFGQLSCVEAICDLSEENCAYYFCEMLFLSSSSSISTPISYNKFSPIHCACLNGHDECVSYLLERLGDDNENDNDDDENDNDCTPSQEKQKTNNNDETRLMCELEDDEGNRPLHVCAIKNECDCAAVLLHAGCRLNVANARGHTPLMLAAAHNSFNMIEMLLSSRAVAERGGGEGVGEENNDGGNRCNLTLVDKSGNSALHLALLNGNENCALLLLDHLEERSASGLINIRNRAEQTPLHLAASRGFVTCVEILLSKGADLWIKDKRSLTPILACAKSQQTADCLEMLISRLMQIVSSSTPALRNASGKSPSHSTATTAISSSSNSRTPNMMLMRCIKRGTNDMSTNTNTPLSNSREKSQLNKTRNLFNDSTYTLISNDATTLVQLLNDENDNVDDDDANKTGNNRRSSMLSDSDPIANGCHDNDGEAKLVPKCILLTNEQNLNSTLIMNDIGESSTDEISSAPPPLPPPPPPPSMPLPPTNNINTNSNLDLLLNGKCKCKCTCEPRVTIKEVPTMMSTTTAAAAPAAVSLSQVVDSHPISSSKQLPILNSLSSTSFDSEFY
jgi:ankyrin repeat protein